MNRSVSRQNKKFSMENVDLKPGDSNDHSEIRDCAIEISDFCGKEIVVGGTLVSQDGFKEVSYF